MGAVFITGTDTGVGKTVVAAGLLASLRGEYLDAVPMKPVQTGAELENGRLVSPDLRFCLKAAGLNIKYEKKRLMCPYCFEPECSPHLAAEMSGVSIQIEEILRCYNKLLSTHKTVIVEGAGGVLAPISESETMMDIIRALAIPVVLVARRGLGTLNHTLLSLSELRHNNVEVLGVILNTVGLDGPDYIVQDNVKTIEKFVDVRVLGTIGTIADMSAIGASFREFVPGWEVVLDRLTAK
ncbi:MAG: dethiobiotin synthase [Armatimonadota bacterium]|nr:dethiobiotin synthase [Armatimonadota bacterium]